MQFQWCFGTAQLKQSIKKWKKLSTQFKNMLLDLRHHTLQTSFKTHVESSRFNVVEITKTKIHLSHTTCPQRDHFTNNENRLFQKKPESFLATSNTVYIYIKIFF